MNNTNGAMSAKVVAYTQAVDNSITNAMEFIAYVARVSNPSNQHNNLTAPKLIKYLQKHKHWSPFEHYSLTLEIECPKDIAVQILRHRSFKFQEFSQRYADVSEMGFTTRECRLQDTKNRQNSLQSEDEALSDWWQKEQQVVLSIAQDAYTAALANGIAKEQARAVLPLGLTISRLYMTGDIRSWLHYLAVRLDSTTQKEHRELARLMALAIGEYFDLSDFLKTIETENKQ